VFDGALLIGDAAGFINPLTGGGIHNSLLSARLAAQTIDEAFKAGDTSRQGMQVYEQRVQERMGSSMKRAYLIQRGLEHFPWLVDFITARTGEDSALVQMFLEKL
jgi:flavin-dependent dehydrogenase